MKRDDIKEFLELAAGFKKSSRMLAEAEDDEESGEEGEEESSEEKDSEEEVKVSKEEEVELNKSLDDSLNAIFVDIESDSLKSAKVQKESRYSLKDALYEDSSLSADSIDIEKFAAETARLIKNSDVLLDIPMIILAKARDYLTSKYDVDVEKKFLELMQTRFGIDHRTEREKQESEDDINVPLAMGAGAAAGGG